MKLDPYLVFPGTCAEAMRFYERTLGGRIETMQKMGESPMAEHTPPERHDHIMHARMRLGPYTLMASDAPPEHYHKPQGVSLSLGVDEPGEAERIFSALSEGGEVTMPLQPTFWARAFGMATDRYGVHWMVNCEAA